MFELENVLRPYAWGSKTAIAELLGREASGGPEAELWIGAHPDSPSQAVGSDGQSLALDALIAGDPAHFLGSASLGQFGPRLPFLTKILAAETPLSLQVHPSLEQAKEGFAAENRAGMAPDSPSRNYRDDNHKPEMIFALTPFEALCGFRPPAESSKVFAHIIGFLELAGLDVPAVLPAVVEDLSLPDESAALRAAFTRLISGGQEVSDAAEHVAAALRSGAPMTPHTAALSTLLSLNGYYPGDPGVLISLLLNVVSLAPGEAVYLPAGNVHAYLNGLGVEVMATSDNVLRGGLTPKHIDVPELLKTIEFRSLGVPKIQAEQSALGQELYRPPFREFQLQRIELSPGSEPVPLAQNGPAIVVVTLGAVVLDSPKGDLPLNRGASAFIPDSESPVMVHPAAGLTGRGIAFAVTTSLEA
ncbi:mannose-6-phosphate isomerase, class I [Arthrobacter sp. ISL-30]|uniref:mannose-6-phosphate isomerase, class I n=1 Tax=Arthrobacter sp. ISL-30 TaxID=2819109 RepID=UPI001BEBAF97|nr:mannose-6-phosphate isomerase, class I [Arthrobacter sp. ISL-30]MBT2515609.1 mannose-6-phosphate isomerase, class I [Arthrobacter sp. ISL-30]